MENPDPSNHNSKKILRRSSNSHISISDTESATSQVDSFHSPLRSESPFRSEDPCFHTENVTFSSKNSKTHVSVDATYYPPLPSPGNPNLKAVSPLADANGRKPWPRSEKPTSQNLDLPLSSVVADEKGQIPFPQSQNLDFQAKGGQPTLPMMVFNMSVKEESTSGLAKLGPVGGGVGGLEEGYGGGREEMDREWRSRAAVTSILKRSRRNVDLKRAALGLRIFEVIVCLISFSVMAADKTRGWAGDSYYRYKEYRYCLAINVIGFVYAGFQACVLAYYSTTRKHVISPHLRYHFDFSMDQILAYLLMSASSSAATRVDDWVANWGKDEFTTMASASIAISFLAFVAFAINSLISGYNLCYRDST